MGYLRTEKESGVAVIWLDQPDEKINKLSLEIIDEFKFSLDDLGQDEKVRGIVVISAKPDCFIAGADLEKMARVADPGEGANISREANQFLRRVADFPKPIVAAIHGAALGGGLETAMACHYRIASDSPKTVLALPEVKLGLLPAAGGTQRLPRLVGIRQALSCMLTGANIYPAKARKMGLVDEVVQPHILLEAAKKIALRMAEGGCKRPRRKSGLVERLLEGNFLGRALIFRAARKTVRKTAGNYPAPFKIIDCVSTGSNWGLLRGIDAEARNFGELLAGKISKELIRLFFGMNSRKKNPHAEHARPLRKVGVVGGGLMGAGIAQVTAVKQETPVIVKDLNAKSLENIERILWEELSEKVRKKAISPFERDVIRSRVFPTTTYHGFEKADIVVEAVFEDLELKRNVLSEVEEIASPECVFASNTSCIPISEIAAGARRPERVLGMHYFSPVPLMPLLEIVVTEKTADWALATAFEMGIRQGKTSIVVRDGPGFYTTRILAPLLQEAIALLEEGGEMRAIDQSMKKFGFPVGPITLLDEVGIDVGAHVSKIMGRHFADRGIRPPDSLESIERADYRGRKNRRGFYLYPADKGRKKEPNLEIYEFFGGKARRKIPAEEIRSRLTLIMVNEAAHCLQEGILKSPEDGDLGAILGLGFPPFLGGPFRYLDSLEPAKTVARLEALAEKHGAKFAPAPILKDMACSNDRFYKNRQ